MALRAGDSSERRLAFRARVSESQELACAATVTRVFLSLTLPLFFLRSYCSVHLKPCGVRVMNVHLPIFVVPANVGSVSEP